MLPANFIRDSTLSVFPAQGMIAINAESRIRASLVSIGTFFAAIGVTLTFVIDYDHLGTAILGRTFGIGTLVTVVPFAFMLGASDISGSSEQKEQGLRYKEKAERFKERYKISIAPTINMREPGGGLFMRLGF